MKAPKEGKHAIEIARDGTADVVGEFKQRQKPSGRTSRTICSWASSLTGPCAER